MLALLPPIGAMLIRLLGMTLRYEEIGDAAAHADRNPQTRVYCMWHRSLRREYLERVRSKAFRVSTVLIPLVFAVIFGMGSFSGKLAGGAKYIVVASNDATLAENVGAEQIRKHQISVAESATKDMN